MAPDESPLDALLATIGFLFALALIIGTVVMVWP